MSSSRSTKSQLSVNSNVVNRKFRSDTQITVLEDTSDDEYVSTVEDNSHISDHNRFSETSRNGESSATRTSCSRSYVFSDTTTDVSRSITERSDVRVYQRQAVVNKINLLNKSPEQTPLLLRVVPLKKGRLVELTGTRISTPVETVHLVQAKKHTVSTEMVPSLVVPRFCYETVPSFLSHTANLQFILRGKEETIKALVLPPKQNIKKGVLPRETSTPLLLLPPEGPAEATVLQPLWDTVTFTISFGKHVAVEYSIPQVPVRKVRFYKAEKHSLRAVNAAVLYRKTKKEPVIIEKCDQVHYLQLDTVEKEDPQIVRIVRLEQNNTYFGHPSEKSYTVTTERRATSTTISEQYRPRRK